MAQVGSFVSLDELGYPRASVREVVQMARRVNRDAGLVVLGMFNLVQSMATAEGVLTGRFDARVEAQERLLAQSLSARRLLELRDKLGAASLLDRPLLHRAQLLVTIKLIARYGRPVGGIDFARRDDLDLVGEMALAINSLYDFGVSSSEPAHSIAAALAPTLELENPPRPDRSLVRTEFMLEAAMQRAAATNPLARNLERIFVLMTGLNFEQFRDMTFAVFSFYGGRKITDMIAHQALAHLNPLSAENIVSARHLRGFLRHVSVAFGEIPGMAEPAHEGARYLLDMTPFRRTPVWRFADDDFFCLDPAFLLERLGPGFYWSVMDALDDERRRDFSSLWGLLFQEYALELLRVVYPPQSNILVSQPHFETPNEEAFDAILDFGGGIIALEIKGPLIPIAAKYSGDPADFFAGIDSKFGDVEGGAVRQLAVNLKHAFSSHPSRRLRGFPDRHLQEIFPVVVVQDPILKLGLSTKPLVQSFQSLTHGTVWLHGSHVWPLVVVTRR